MIVLDTSALIRFFTNDVPLKAQKVKTLIENKEKLIIPDVVFPELEYVLLGKTYNASREKILTAFQYLSVQKNINISKEVKKAISLYKTSTLDIADCIIAASAYKQTLMSFDKKLKKTHSNIN